MKMSRHVEVEQQVYHTFALWRTYFFRPLAWALTQARISPSMVSLAGVVAMGGFVLSMPESPRPAVLFLVLSVLLDWLDGPLARFQRQASDRGKFLDMLCDSTSFTLFMLGVVNAGLITGVIGMLLVYLVLLSKVLRILWRSRFLKSDWLFRPVAGFLPNFGVGLSYVAFIFFALRGGSIMMTVSYGVTIILLLDILVSLQKILKLEHS